MLCLRSHREAVTVAYAMHICRIVLHAVVQTLRRNVVHKPCAEPGCVTLAVFNQPGAGHGLYCGQHKPMGYVNVKVIAAFLSGF